jgi:hypothetical protein
MFQILEIVVSILLKLIIVSASIFFSLLIVFGLLVTLRTLDLIQTKIILGEWDKETLYKNLTHYGNLVLLSDGEAHPLVCMEALASGLGVVVCEWGKANLDTTQRFYYSYT